MTHLPRLSVVVACSNARDSVRDCLWALVPGPDVAVEILAVDNSTDGTGMIVRDEFPSVRVLSLPSSTLVPELWSAGIKSTRGEVVALTTAHCIPAPDWVSAILTAHDDTVAAAGGAIESHRLAGWSDWALYFCRYSMYMLPFEAQDVREIAADNASYKRRYLDACPAAWHDGFWEPAVHEELRRAGARLRLSPSIVVVHRRSLNPTGFIRQRFLHGARFGRDRAARLRWPTRALLVGASPILPLLLLGRIARQVLRKRRNRLMLVWCLPMLLVFLLAWATGEGLGSLRGRRA